MKKNLALVHEETTMKTLTSESTELERRHRIQKLRWLGMHEEADRLASAAAAPERSPRNERKVPLPAACPDTD
ncbi:MAG TPA: hypothetical protein VMC10_08695 [Stellaceae bacterium]|nr:hypothetical protein [Stellaceae bacterium]